MATQKEVFTISVSEDGHVVEKKYAVFLDGGGKEIARSAPTTQTVDPGDPMKRYSSLSNTAKGIVDLVQTPAVIAAYEAKMDPK